MSNDIEEYKRQESSFSRFLRNWNEFLFIPVALILWKLHVWYITAFDATAATPDAGIFSFAVAAVIIALFLRGFSWLIIRINFPGAFKYLTEYWELDLWQLPRKQRVYVALLYYFGVLYSLIFLFKTGV
jgi:hypothetical protein